ncbi:HlyD family efflux transporter periplasmic adaptor subunit [Clostridium sp.]|uniref:HlyD family efflux transporter periplasmic adaptor subunit n=1 Tax=Clostridium sp. TaxID=1506 RepID=UPI003F4CA10C
MKLDLMGKIKGLKFKEILKKITVKKVITVVVLAVALFAGFKSSFIQNKFFAKKEVIDQNTIDAKKGNLMVLVSGSGPISFTNSSEIYSKIGATVTKVNYKEGDTVKAGDILYELDDSDAQTSANSDLNSFKQNQISASSSDDAVNDLTIKAPFAGVVSDIVVKQGDTVSKEGTVFTIADTSKLKVLLTYNASAAGKIAIGQTAVVNLTSLMQSVNGTVTYISNVTTSTSAGGTLYTVEIQINNPGAVIEGMTATADISAKEGEISSTGSAELNYIKKQLVTSLTGGTVASINVKQSQKVGSGQALIKMNNDEITRAKQNSDLQLENARLQMTLKDKQLDDYKIIAPIDGVITMISNKVGDTIKAGDALSNVSDPTQMQFEIPVDELDIAKFQVGQKTNITVDALPDTTKTPVNGEIAKIAVTGESENGVTNFVVTVKINDNLDKLKGGMNANGEVEVSNRENVLYVPIEAITTVDEKSFVYTKAAGARAAKTGSKTGDTSDKAASMKNSAANSEGESYYAGSIRTEVQLGLNNDTSIEITSGLKEGDVIVLPETTAASTVKSSSGGGMGGGRPGGEF